MGTMNVVMAVVEGIVIIIASVSLITVVVTLFTKGKNSNEKIFLGKLANTDSSIGKAIKHLKLTNGIEE